MRHFNPPAMAIHLQEDLAYLADIWNQSFLQGSTSIPIPWGWDYDTRAYIHRHYGIKMTQLPTDDDLLLLRQLSSRQITVSLCQHLAVAMPELQFPQPCFIATEGELFDYVRNHDQSGKPYVLKTLWSSSGRGLMTSHVTTPTGITVPRATQQMMNHGLNAIRKMGGIMAEDWIDDKRQDFAMLFEATGDCVRFLGYSLFDNDDSRGGITYRCGYLMSNERIEQRLGIDPSVLHNVAHFYKEELTHLLNPLLGHEWPLGYIGVDMLTTATGLHPCIELNLRTTMGVVCRLWYDQHLEEGRFRISEQLADGHFRAEFDKCMM